MADEEEYYEEGEGEEEYYEEEEGGGDDADEIQKRMNEMEDELNKLNQLQSSVEKKIGTATDTVDEHSIYIGQVDYEASTEELRAHFAPCGSIDKIVIICDHHGNSKGFAYIAFVDKESVANALKLDDTPFKGRQLKVLPKRHNIPASILRGGGRGGRGFRGRGGRYYY
jgi:polyadenylate-binding protein 2